MSYAKGCRLSKTDVRDYRVRAGAGIVLPDKFMLKHPQKIKQQGSVNSCVAHATSSILEYHDKGQHTLSTNFIYGFMDDHEMGMYLRDACDIVRNYGDVLDSECPGNYEKPMAHRIFQSFINDSNINNAYPYHIESYFSCATYRDIKYAIYKYGPVLGALRWYDDCWYDYDGNVHFDQNSAMGYHAIVIYGWDETGFWCQNSWGVKWGKQGNFHIDYADNLIAEARAFIDYDNNKDDTNLEVPTIPKPIAKLSNKILNAWNKTKS